MKKHGHFQKLNNGLAKIIALLPKSWIHFLYNRFRNVSGYLGLGVRYICIKNIAKNCGDNVAIFPACTIKHIESISLGNNVSIHPYCYIDAVGGIEIGNDVSIANHSSLISFGHTWDDETEPIKYNPLILTPIKINSDVWIGCGVRIIGPCEIKTRTIIAAGAVVKGVLDGNTIYGGIPSKIIKSLENKETSTRGGQMVDI